MWDSAHIKEWEAELWMGMAQLTWVSPLSLSVQSRAPEHPSMKTSLKSVISGVTDKGAHH